MAADVRNGYISLETARRDYGVVLTQDGAAEVDEKATAALRGKGRAS